MDIIADIAGRFLMAFGRLWLNPFTYIGLLLVILQYRKQIQFERKLFATSLHSLVGETWRTYLWGWAAGLAVSVAMLFIGVSIQLETVLLLWVLSILMILIRIRFLCLAYSVGLLGILQPLLSLVPQQGEGGFWNGVLAAVRGADVPSLLALVAILHAAEAVLIRAQGSRMASPMFYEGKRGKIVGGYQLQGFWLAPLFLAVPVQAGAAALPWTPLFAGDSLMAGWTFLAFPAMIGFSELTMTRLPREKVNRSSGLLLIYALVLFLAALLAQLWSPFTIVAAVLGIALHEAVMWYGRWEEAQRSPYYINQPRGLKILAVVPGSPAEELGLKPGELVHKVNGLRVHSKSELHQAIQLSSAYCKLEIADHAGELRFHKRAVFAGDHYQLGIIICPDQEAVFYVETRQLPLLTYLTRKLTGLLKKDSEETF
ncbi:PDZ domain-containing protein [Paenibacillus sp. FJAT-26967]|uniref:PDZ domain-containing protein n=1 Tax=Paenibacillus sp. FJAT-26967 TaxID=1729690 RepID=UPI0008389F96|nr:PDZ domain-containing protein [Paenibacillus sp. FJAT-26967]